MMHGGRAAHLRRFVGYLPDHLLRRLTFTHFLFEVRQGFHEEKRCYDWQVESVEEDRLVKTEALKRGFIENNYGSPWH